MQKKAKATGYVISSDNRIVSVSGDWDEFALDNSAPEAQATNVVGHSLWHFVSGFETQSFLNALFFHVRRTGQPVILQYNCNAPDRLRVVDMEIRLLDGQHLEVLHDIHTDVPMEQTCGQMKSAPSDSLTVCSQCLDFVIDRNWEPAESRPLVLNGEYKYVVCSSCRSAARNQVELSFSSSLEASAI